MQVACPQCGKMLESPYPLPERAQCPFCGVIFQPAAPRSAPPPLVTQPTPAFTAPRAPYVVPNLGVQPVDQVRTPAIGMLIAAVLSLLYVVADLIFSVMALQGFQPGPPPANLPPLLQKMLQPDETQLIFAAIFDVARIVACTMVILGAIKMQRLESYGLAVTSGILSLIPCITCCCFLGIPFGIWALVVLNRPEVRARFR